MGKANSPVSVPHTFPLTAPVPRPELLLLCMAEWPLLPPLDVRWRLEALDEKELTKQKQQEEFSSEGLKDLWSGKNPTGCTASSRRNADGV